MVTLGEIEVGEPLRPLSLVQQGVDVRQGLDKGLGDGIETSVVVEVHDCGFMEVKGQSFPISHGRQ